MYNKNQGLKKPIIQEKSVILFFHGGGWIICDTEVSSDYLIRFAKETDALVISVDYRKTPQHAFPAALDDCWQVYRWVLENSEGFLGIKIKKLILVGDSAGGNMAAALTIKCIQSQVQLPSGILFIYAPFQLSDQIFSPSYLQLIQDPIVNLSMTKFILKKYINGNFNPKDNILTSPLYMPDFILSQFPKARLIIGGEDCMLDDQFRFLQRMAQLKLDTFLKIYKGFPHGICSYSTLYSMQREANEFVSGAIEFLKELLK